MREIVIPLDPQKMTFSGLKRYVLISEVVANTDAHLSGAERHELTQELVSELWNPTVAQVEERCAALADVNSGGNMINAQILRDRGR